MPVSVYAFAIGLALFLFGLPAFVRDFRNVSTGDWDRLRGAVGVVFGVSGMVLSVGYHWLGF